MQEKSLKIIEQVPIGLVTFSLNGEIDYINQNFKKFGALYQFETPTVVGGNVLQADIFPYNTIIEELRELLSGTPFEKQLKKIETQNGQYIDLIIKGSPIYDDDEITGGMLLIEDIKIIRETKVDIKQRSDYFEQAIHNVSDALIVTDNEGIVQFLSGSTLKKLNLSKTKSVDKYITELFDSKTNNLLSQNIEKVRVSNTSTNFEFDSVHREGKNSYNCRIEPIQSKRGTLQFLFIFINNITQTVSETHDFKHRLEEFSYYKSINDNLRNALFALDSDGKIIYWNKQSEELFDQSAEKVTGKFFGTALDLFDIRFFETIKKDLVKEKIWKVNLNIFGKEHKKEILEARFSYLDDYQNTIVVLCTNISRKIKEEEERNLREDSLNTLLENSNEIICKFTSKGMITYANKKFLTSLGFNVEEVSKCYFESIVDKNYIEGKEFDINNIKKNEPTQTKLHLVDKSGKGLFVEVKFVPSKKEGNSLNYLCYMNEIKPSKDRNETELLYPALFTASQDGIAVETDSKIVIANDSFANIFGYSKGKELAGKDLLDLVSNDDILKVAEYFRLKEQDKSAPDRFEFLGKRKDNSQFFTELSVSSFEENDRKYIVMVTRDITERKRAQKAIRESEEKYRNITDNIDDFLYTFERARVFMRPIFYTSAVEKITGYSQAEFLEDSKLMLKIIHPDDFAKVKKKISSIIASKNQNSGEIEFRIINKHGNIVWVRNKVNFIKNEKGTIQKIYGLVSDISINKRAEEELRKSTESLIKLNETKDRFISIISHDLRTPFSSILGFTDLLANDDELTNEERQQYVKYIQESSKSMLSLVNSLLDWTRLQTGRIKFEPERFDAKTLIEKSIHAMTGDALRKNVEIFSTVAAGQFVYADKSLISQVINNLLSNAIKFTKSEDKITISVKSSEDDGFLEFAVKDTGLGIREENLERLFNVDTKYTTEGTSGEKGSGLGLSLVQEIVAKHGGKVWAESEYNKGSVFRFTLPIAAASILIVDNNRTDSLLYSKILKNIKPDYKVDVASNGNEALKKIKTSTPALVITEHSMPEMNGYNFVKELIKLGILGKPPV
ncbi:MAG: PAS domain S-box protein, partial [Ignavibacteria bacterium]